MSELDFKGPRPTGARPDLAATRTSPAAKASTSVAPTSDRAAASGFEPASPGQENDPLAPEALQEVVERLAEAAHQRHPNLHFAIDEESGRAVVQVIDKSSGDVIRQIPSEQALSAARKIAEQGGGALLEITV